MRLIAQSLMMLPYRVRYYSPPLYPYNGLVIKALRVSPQFNPFYMVLTKCQTISSERRDQICYMIDRFDVISTF